MGSGAMVARLAQARPAEVERPEGKRRVMHVTQDTWDSQCRARRPVSVSVAPRRVRRVSAYYLSPGVSRWRA